MTSLYQLTSTHSIQISRQFDSETGSCIIGLQFHDEYQTVLQAFTHLPTRNPALPLIMALKSRDIDTQ